MPTADGFVLATLNNILQLLILHTLLILLMNSVQFYFPFFHFAQLRGRGKCYVPNINNGRGSTEKI